jgi:hypothetical protein
MKALVRSESATLRASKLALVAGERPLAGMNTQVPLEIAFVCESKLALVAGVRAIVDVDTHGCISTESAGRSRHARLLGHGRSRLR